ncbi:AAA family ATPase [Candidatus Woesearchaeota archaeon CG10_big_fil_rev_8_21_14_0_10_37_12]|nr:MAG: AAA family ATPase [Candidatus Woesearchaeota archaeon CG10_big_fil_rev_8_21_14_0_10_37_12]
MDATTLVNIITEFLEKNYYDQLLEKVRRGEKSLSINFTSLAEYNPEIADMLLDQPQEILKAGEIAINQLNLGQDIKGFIIRFANLPASAGTLIRQIRSKHLGKLLTFQGVVRNKSEVRPQVASAKFECPSCGNTHVILQLDSKFHEPTKCSCGRKGKFTLVHKDLVDAQMMVLEEDPEQLEGGEQPKRMNVLLQNDLVSPLTEKKTNPGSKVQVIGEVKEVPIYLRSGGQSTKFDLFIEANNFIPIESDYTDIKISPEEEQEIKKLAKKPDVLTIIRDSIAPSIYGHEKIKEALALQAMGGIRKKRDDGVVTRGDIHMLFVGDPGAAKSQLLKRMQVVAPKARYITGKGASGAGLSAAVVKDEFLQGWSLEAGALVLANKGLCMIDEMDKMSKEDGWAMHEALEQQTVTISKANIQASLRCETTVLAAANPKFGRFDPYDTIANQINMAPTLINRFDLIFPIKDLPDPTKDEKLAQFVLELHQNNVETPQIPTELLRKYIAYARQNMFPKLTDAAIIELKEYYLKMRASVSSANVKSVPISARQLEGLVRLSEAHAKMRLSEKVEKKDAKKAIELLDYCLRQVALDEKTGTFDIDRIATDTPASSRNKLHLIKEIINELEQITGKTIPLDDILKAASSKDVNERETEEIIQKLKRAGDIFEPRRGFISKI